MANGSMFVHKDRPFLKVKYLRYKVGETDEAGKERLGRFWNIPGGVIRMGDIMTFPEYKSEVPDFIGED